MLCITWYDEILIRNGVYVFRVSEVTLHRETRIIRSVI